MTIKLNEITLHDKIRCRKKCTMTVTVLSLLFIKGYTSLFYEHVFSGSWISSIKYSTAVIAAPEIEK